MFTQVAEYSFAYGVQYAWNLVIFAMVMTFSLTAPLIVPAGMLYAHALCTVHTICVYMYMYILHDVLQ